MKNGAVLLTAYFVLATLAKGDQFDDRAQAIRAIRAAGGSWECDEEALAKPVVRVELSHLELKDKDSVLEQLAGLPKLKILNLADTDVSDEQLAHVAKVTSLELLSLDGTPVTNKGLEHLKDLPSISLLSLSFTNVTDAGVAHLQAWKRLERLHLNSTQITATSLKTFAEIKTLRSLNIANTKITIADFEASGLKEIRSLYIGRPALRASNDAFWKLVDTSRRYHLQRNGFNVEIRFAEEDRRRNSGPTIGYRHDLRYVGSDENYSFASLRLQNATIGRSRYEEFKELSRLQRLTLVNVRVNSELFELPMLEQLVELEVQDCKVDPVAWTTSRRPKNLESVVLVGTGGGDDAIRLLCQPKVRRIVMGNVRMSEAGLALIAAGSAASLEELDLTNARVNAAGLAALTVCRKLRDLRVSGTDFDDTMLPPIAKLEQLETLDLEFTKVTDAGLPILKQLPKFQKLNLAHTSVTDAGLRALAACPSLTQVDLQATKVTAVGIAWLQIKRPSLQVIE